MQRVVRLRSPVPRSTNGEYIRGVRDLTRSGTLNDGVSIPSQESPEPIRTYNPPGRGQPDIRRIYRDLESSRGLPNVNPDLHDELRKIRHPGSIRLINHSNTTLGTLPALGGHIRYRMKQVLPVRPDRKRFVLCNPDTNANTVYFTYGNNPNALIPLYVGQPWDENGAECSSDDIWIGGPNAGDLVIVYEGRLTGEYD